ncbi:Six-hairpin glycosidase-like protein [Xylaria cf. heliscus]|nr:Six-hairpin glycosidase-like protein [Xylaria cf. heliscus]
MRATLCVATLAATLFGVPTTAADALAKPKYSQRMASGIMARGQGVFTGNGGSSEALQAGIVQKAFTALVAQYPSSATPYQQYIATSASSTIPYLSNATNDALTFPLDRLSNGNALLTLSTCRTTVDALRQSIDLNRRNSAGGLWYFVYPNWSYLDGMYSLAPFYTLYTLTTTTDSKASAAAITDMLYQFDTLWNHTIHSSTGLLSHGYDASRTAVWADPVTGASPIVWGRSLGWYTMALVDTIEILENQKAPYDYRAPLLDKFQRLMPAVLKAVDPLTGGWWQVVDQPGKAGNYIESSSTAMFAYSLLKGVRLGYIPYNLALAATLAGIRAQFYLTDNFVVQENNGTLSYNGTVAVCSLNSTATYQYYVGQPLLYNSVLGSGAYILASLEVEKLGL